MGKLVRDILLLESKDSIISWPHTVIFLDNPESCSKALWIFTIHISNLLIGTLTWEFD